MRIMTKKWMAIACCAAALMACEKEGEDELEGKWQLLTVEEGSAVQTVDTVWYNFQTSLFMYQFYTPSTDTYQQNYGYKTWTGSNEIELELISYGGSLSEFLLNTDWSSATRTFTVDKCSGSTLILSSEGKTYSFKKF